MHKRILVVTLILWAISGLSSASQLSLPQQYTWQALQLQKHGLENTTQYIADRSLIFNRESAKTEILSREQRATLLDTWQLYQDYLSTLGQVAAAYQFAQHAHTSADFQLYALAVSTHHRYAMQAIALVESDSEIIKWLNNGHPERNLAKHHYRDFRRYILSAAHTRRYNAVAAISFNQADGNALVAAIEQQRAAINNQNRFATIATGTAARVTETAYKGWFPLQKGVASGMGKVKFWRVGQTLISPDQAYEYSRHLEPGDLYVTRKEWRMTNLGIPGYWTHSAIYIGSVSEREQYFDTPEVVEWVKQQGIESGSLEELLLATSAEYRAQPQFDDLGEIRVIEALNPGVIFNSMETSLDADGFAAFRPRLSKLEKAMAIHASFKYTGRPYDFGFDFDTDDAMVCSELLYKAYQPSSQQQGINFPIERVAGRKMLTPNDIAIWFEETRQSPSQELDLVLFVDSNEKAKTSFIASEEAFLGSHRRPKWYAFIQPPVAIYANSHPNLELADQSKVSD